MLKFLDNMFWGDTYNTRVKVTFIDHLNDYVIDEGEFEQIHLPEDFRKVNTIILAGHEYKIVRAEPSHALQYTLTKKLSIRINSADFLRFRKILNDPSSGMIKFGNNQPD